jgi:ComF family protein
VSAPAIHQQPRARPIRWERVIAFTRALLELLASTVAPNRCAACDDDVPMMTAFCPSCASTLTLPDARDPRHIAAFVYGGAIARAIARLKFEKRPDVARPLAAALRRAARVMAADPPEIVVPVPLHPRRLVERGFNQSALLAAPVARDLGASFLPLGLLRARDTEHQATLDRSTRATNVVGAFRAPRPAAIQGRRALLIDDVRTSGATLAACAEALFAAGARDVRSLVVAQTE